MQASGIKCFLQKTFRVMRGGILLLAALSCIFVFSSQQHGYAEDESAVTSSSCGSFLSCLSIILGQVECACNCPIINHGAIQSLIFREHARTMYYFGVSVPGDIGGALAAALPPIPGFPFMDLIPGLSDLLGNILTGILSAFGALPSGLGGVDFLPKFINPPPPDTDPPAVYPFDPPPGAFYKEGANRIFKYQNWFIDVFFRSYVNQLLEIITMQMMDVMMHQTAMIGAMMDAKNQLETQALFQRLAAQAHKDYHPSMGMCEFGTIMISMAPGEHNGKFAKGILDEGFLKRQMGSGNDSASEGPAMDRKSRLELFQWRFCNTYDNNRVGDKVFTGLDLVCDPALAGPWPNPGGFMEHDVSFINSIFLKRTLRHAPPDTWACIHIFGFTPYECIRPDDHGIYAMDDLLYGHDVFSGVPSALLADENSWDEHLDMRSVIAKRAIAAESFHNLISIKTQGSPDDPAPFRWSSQTREWFMEVVFQSLGMPAGSSEEYLGHSPSYMAFLEFMAKKLYQRPQFYTELYDTPANIKRKGVAMQAIGLMIDRDIYESQLRSESIMALILETKLTEAQKQVENKVKSISAERLQ